MLEEDGKYFNKRWGYLSRAGLNDKSQFTRQIEKYAGASSSSCTPCAKTERQYGFENLSIRADMHAAE